MTDSSEPQPRAVPTLRTIARRLASHALLIGGIAFVVLVAVALWTFLVAPRYESTAVLRILDAQGQSSLAVPDAVSSLPGADMLGFGRDELDTEVGVLRSRRIASAVVDSTALMVRVTSPGGVRDAVLSVQALGDPDRSADLALDWGGQAYAVTIEEPDEEAHGADPVAPGGTLEYAGYRLELRAPPADSLPRKIRIEIHPRYEAVADLREDMDIRQQEGGSRLVEVSYRATDRILAAAVVNGIVDEYVAYKTRSERSEARSTAAELRKQVALQLDSLRVAEDRLRAYQEANRIVAPEEEATQQVKRIAQLQLQHDALEVEREALANLLAIIDERAAEREQDAQAAYRQLATFPSLISNGAIEDLLNGLLELENERAELLTRRTDVNADVRQYTSRIHEIEGQLHRLGTDYLQSLDEQLASTGAALERLDEVIGALPEREVGYLRLLRDRTVLNESYLLLERQLRLAEVQDAIRAEGVRIVDVARVAHPDDPAFPNPPVNLFLGLVFGLALGVAAALVRDLWGEEPAR